LGSPCRQRRLHGSPSGPDPDAVSGGPAGYPPSPVLPGGSGSDGALARWARLLWRCGPGSKPLGYYGPHLASLRVVSASPRNSPHSRRAVTAYSLQVGVNRHVGGRIGDTYCRYSSIRNVTSRDGAARIRETRDGCGGDRPASPAESVVIGPAPV